MQKNNNIETSSLRNPQVDPALIKRSREIIDRELEIFRKRTPRSAQWLVEAAHSFCISRCCTYCTNPASIAQAGPSVSYAMDEAGVDTCIALAGDFLDALTN